MKDARFMCCDFRKVLSNISFGDESALCRRSDTFIYSDAPYIGTDGWYTHNSNSEQDCIDHLDMLVNSDIRFGVSEFDNEIVMDLATDRKLNIVYIGERRNLKNRRTEILLTNYNLNQPTLF